MEGKGLVEYTNYIDIKGVLYAIAVALGYYSHFVLVFPRDWQILVACVASYAVIVLVTTYIDWFCEKDCFFISKSHPVSHPL